MNELAELFHRHVTMPDRREVWEWAAENVDFGRRTSFKGRYDVNNVPWTKEFLRACNNPIVREVTMVAPPQDSGKTKAAETYLGFRICTSPANFAFNTTTNVKAEQWSETRWDPMLKSIARIEERFSKNLHEKKRRRIVFKDGTFLLIQGAEVEGNRTSDSVEVQINDEVYLWDRPQLKEMHERTNSYRDSRKIINISVGGSKRTELEERFLAGNQMEWSHVCPACEKVFDYVFDSKNPRCNIRFDLNAAIVHTDGRLDLRAFAKTIFVECQACKHRMGYDRERLRRANLAGVYVARNPEADPSIVSLHVNAFALGREPWVEILEPWVRMNIRGGVFNAKALKEFITKKLAEFWDEKPIAVTNEIKLAGWNRADVLRKGSWPEEWIRIMACDNQRGRKGDIPHRWFGGIALSRVGRMRVFDFGRINEWNDLRKKQLELSIPDPTPDAPGPWVAVDRRYEPVEVDEWCARFKWYGSMGASQSSFLHPPWSPLAGTYQLFSEPRMIDIGFGTAETGRTFASWFAWSSQMIQDLVAQLRNAGMIEFPADSLAFCPEVGTHMNSHRSFMELDKKGNEIRVWKRIGDTPDHIYDIVSQAVVIGCMAGIYDIQQAAVVKS